MATLTAPITPAAFNSSKTADETDLKQSPEAINAAIAALQDLANIQLKLQKERGAIEQLDLVQRMLDGEMLSEEDLLAVKRSLKGLGKYAGHYADYQTALERAQQARDLIDQIIGYPEAGKSA